MPLNPSDICMTCEKKIFNIETFNVVSLLNYTQACNTHTRISAQTEYATVQCWLTSSDGNILIVQLHTEDS